MGDQAKQASTAHHRQIHWHLTLCAVLACPAIHISIFTDHTRCDRLLGLTDQAMADYRLHLTRHDIGLDGRPICSKF